MISKLVFLSVAFLSVNAFSSESPVVQAPIEIQAPKQSICDHLPTGPSELGAPPACCYWNVEYEPSYEIPQPWHWARGEQLVCFDPNTPYP